MPVSFQFYVLQIPGVIKCIKITDLWIQHQPGSRIRTLGVKAVQLLLNAFHLVDINMGILDAPVQNARLQSADLDRKSVV